ncbi:MAG: hypothetical protein B7Z81_01510 [Acidocella sp. 20-61-6]|nr:MAG: hypothetical protein B7Z81_01510 [Acidocella sp. 20-61-6]
MTGIGVSKSTPGLEAALKKNLDAMMADGTYAAIYKKWHLEADMLPKS